MAADKIADIQYVLFDLDGEVRRFFYGLGRLTGDTGLMIDSESFNVIVASRWF
jgi:hypothetical protein